MKRGFFHCFVRKYGGLYNVYILKQTAFENAVMHKTVLASFERNV